LRFAPNRVTLRSPVDPGETSVLPVRGFQSPRCAVQSPGTSNNDVDWSGVSGLAPGL